IIPPRPPSPSPLIINHQDVEPITPSPCIFREAPPSPPPHEETKIITKVLPQEPPLLPRMIFEHNASVFIQFLFCKILSKMSAEV
ncbi:unnamed protein product, partial [Rotaria sordida]